MPIFIWTKRRPTSHIDFVPYTTGSKRGLETRVSLKQALSALGFKGGARRETELNQWVAYEKEQLAAVMLEHGIEWEKKGTHEKHLSVLDFEKKERAKEVAELETKKAELQEENATFKKSTKICMNSCYRLMMRFVPYRKICRSPGRKQRKHRNRRTNIRSA